MTVRIPIVGERVGTPNTSLRGGQINAPEVSQIGNALTRVGQGAEDLAAGIQRNRERQQAEVERQREEDAKAYAAKTVPQMSLDLDKMDTDARATAQPGAAGYTDALGKQVDGYLANAEKQAPTPQAKQYIAAHGASLRAQVLASAYKFEVTERQANRVNDVDQGRAAAANVVGRDPGKFVSMHTQQKAAIEAMDAPPDVKRKLLEANDRDLSTAAVLSQAERDPLLTEVKLRQRLGLAAGAAGPMDNQALFAAQEHVESRGKQGAVSPAGARGVMQLMPKTARELEAKYGFEPGSSDTDPRINRELGQRYMGEQLAKYGDQATALMAYNWGPGAVDKWIAGGSDPAKVPKETREYVASILPTAGLTPAEGVTTGDPAFDLLDTQQALTLLGRVQAERSRQDTGFRTYVTGRVQDDAQAALDGKPNPNPLQPADFARAYGEQGPVEYAAYTQRQKTGALIPTLATLPPEQLAATVKAAEPQPGDGYSSARQNYVALANAAQQVQTERNADPVAFAAKHGMLDAAPLRLGTDGGSARLRARQASAQAMTQTYGAPFRLLTQAETAEMTQRLAASTPAEKVQTLTQFRDTLDPDGYRAVMAQIAPNQPLTATAGAFLGVADRNVQVPGVGAVSGQQVADRILAGQELLAPAKGGTKVVLASDKLLRDTFTASVGGAYRGAAGAQEQTFDAFRAYYVATANARGKINDPALDDDIVTEALRATTGGITTINDQQVPVPWGIGEDRFQTLAQEYWPRALELAGLPPTTPFDGASLALAGGDDYYVMAGDTPLHRLDGKGLVKMHINHPGPVPATGMSALADSYGASGF